MEESDRSWRSRVTMGCVVLVVASLLTPFVVGCVRYGNAFVEHVESHSWRVLPVMLAGAVAGFVTEFMGVWLTRRLDYGLLIGTAVATLVGFFTVLPQELAGMARLSVAGCSLVLLLTSVTLSLVPRRRNGQEKMA